MILRLTISLPQVLNEIRLEFKMSFSISNFFMGCNEHRKLTKFFYRLLGHCYRDALRHLFIIKVFYSISITFIFNYHVMQYYACFHNVIKSLCSPKTCKPTTIANHAWSTPNARSTSFLVDSWVVAKRLLFLPCGVGLVFTKVDHGGYHQQDNIPLCNHDH